MNQHSAKRLCRRPRDARRGSILVLSAFVLVAMVAMVAFAVDLGYLLVERAQLQRCADAAAMAGAWQLADEGQFEGDPHLSIAMTNARMVANNYASFNQVGSINPSLDLNCGNSITGDIVIGHLADLTDPDAELDRTDPSRFNAVRVRVRRTGDINGLVPSFFSSMLGVPGFEAEGKATAALASNIIGFRAPYEDAKLQMLPLAIDEDSWNDLIAGLANDNWSWDEELEEINPCGDGIQEVNLFPEGTGPSASRGTLDIGSNSSSTSDVSRQIVEGISAEDLEFHNGSLELDGCGEMGISGESGINADASCQLDAIKGQPKVIPVYSEVSNPSGSGTYTIVKFVGIRIVDVDLSDGTSQKRVIVQPAPIIIAGAITGELENTSDLVFTPVRLVR